MLCAFLHIIYMHIIRRCRIMAVRDPMSPARFFFYIKCRRQSSICVKVQLVRWQNYTLQHSSAGRMVTHSHKLRKVRRRDNTPPNAPAPNLQRIDCIKQPRSKQNFITRPIVQHCIMLDQNCWLTLLSFLSHGADPPRCSSSSTGNYHVLNRVLCRIPCCLLHSGIHWSPYQKSQWFTQPIKS